MHYAHKGTILYWASRFLYLLRLETRSAELLSAMWLLCYATALGVSLDGAFQAQSYRAMMYLAPRWAWVAVMGSIGVYQLVAILNGKAECRRGAAMASSLIWTYLASGICIQFGIVPPVWILGTMAFAMSLSFWGLIRGSLGWGSGVNTSA